MLRIIVAMTHGHVIGNKGTIPWDLPNDRRHFQAVTMGKVVVMGRKTFESIKPQNGIRLPGRTIVVLTSNSAYATQHGVITTTSLREAETIFTGRDLIIAGGSQLYEEALPRAGILYLTRVSGEYPGDTFFPTIYWNDWICTAIVNEAGCTMETWVR